MRIIGLTGGIASGKTTVQGMLRSLGAPVLDADFIYHELIAPCRGQAAPLALTIAARFPGVLTADGTLDRRALGARVFANAADRKALEAIAHPAVRLATQQRMDALANAGVALAIYDVPLLYETGLEATTQGVIVVWVPEAVQLQRLMTRNNFTLSEATMRIQSQLPLEEKRRRATWVIDSSGTIEATRGQVETLWRKLTTQG